MRKLVPAFCLLGLLGGCAELDVGITPDTFWPEKTPPTCGEELDQIVTGLADATLDANGSVHSKHAIAIAYSTKTVLGNGGTGNIVIWSDYDGHYRWLCKDVTDFVVDMTRNGSGAILEFVPEEDGTVEKFNVLETPGIHGFTFITWRVGTP